MNQIGLALVTDFFTRSSAVQWLEGCMVENFDADMCTSYMGPMHAHKKDNKTKTFNGDKLISSWNSNHLSYTAIITDLIFDVTLLFL